MFSAALACLSCVAQRAAHEEPPVAVYRAPWRPEGVVGVPAGCQLLAEDRPQFWSETDLASAATFQADRNRAARRGANLLLLVEKLVRPRRDFDCAASQPITDCPATLGAWYEVVTRAYDCDAAARDQLSRNGS